MTDAIASRRGIGRQVLALAIPAIVNNITVPLLGLCDTAIAGHLGDASFIGAMSVGAMMLNVVYWLCGFLRSGTSGLTAQAYGAADALRMKALLRDALAIGMAIALAALLLQRPLLALFMSIINPEAAVRALAGEYFRIGIFAAPAQLAIMAMSGWFIGRQNTFIPMVVSIGVNVVNILVSLLLVFGCSLGFTGIALGTLIAAWCGVLAMAGFALHALRSDREKFPRTAAKSVGARSGSLSEFFHVGADLFLRSFCIMGISMAMTSVSARIGDVALASNAVMTQFFLFFSYFMDGFAFAGEALVGRAVGARDRLLLTRSVRSLLMWGAAMALSFLIIYAVLGNVITALITDDDSVRRAVADLGFFVIALPPITVAAFLFDGIFIGWARTRQLLVTTIIATAAFVIIAFGASGFSEIPSMPRLWLAFEVYLLLRGVLLMIAYRTSPKFFVNL